MFYDQRVLLSTHAYAATAIFGGCLHYYSQEMYVWRDTAMDMD